MKKKSYDTLVNEARARKEKWCAEVEAYPEFEKISKDWDAEYVLVRAMSDARTKANLSQKELADRLGVSQPAVSRALKGKVTMETFARILAACGFEFKIQMRPFHGSDFAIDKLTTLAQPSYP